MAALFDLSWVSFSTTDMMGMSFVLVRSDNFDFRSFRQRLMSLISLNLLHMSIERRFLLDLFRNWSIASDADFLIFREISKQWLTYTQSGTKQFRLHLCRKVKLSYVAKSFFTQTWETAAMLGYVDLLPVSSSFRRFATVEISAFFAEQLWLNWSSLWTVFITMT